MRWLLCRVKGRLCGIPLEHVVETMRVLPLEPIASAPPYVRGLALIRGEALPVVDAATLLEEREEPTRFITLRVGERRVALAVGAVEGIRDLTEAQVQAPPPLLSETQALQNLGVLDRELLVILETVTLLGEGRSQDG